MIVVGFKVGPLELGAAVGWGGEPRSTAPATYRVVFYGCGEKRISAIKAIREITGMTLAEARDITNNNRPHVLLEGLEELGAKVALTTLEQAGVSAKIGEEPRS